MPSTGNGSITPLSWRTAAHRPERAWGASGHLTALHQPTREDAHCPSRPLPHTQPQAVCSPPNSLCGCLRTRLLTWIPGQRLWPLLGILSADLEMIHLLAAMPIFHLFTSLIQLHQCCCVFGLGVCFFLFWLFHLKCFHSTVIHSTNVNCTPTMRQAFCL